MGKKKKPFIEKKTAHKFGLVHRSQKDPLQADEDETQRILLPIATGNSSKQKVPKPTPEEAEKRRDNQKLHGIYFEDDYDYLQHLRPRGEVVMVETDTEPLAEITKTEKKSVTFGNVTLPSELFASETEEKLGMLSRGVLASGLNPNLDPDIVEALDDDFDLDDPDNLLDDDFMTMANEPMEMDNEEIESDQSGSDFGSDYDEEIDGFGSEMDFDKKSRFTEYSMTSSVMHRTEGLQTLDKQFENLMADYDEENIGGLDEDMTVGLCDTDDILIDNALQEFEDSSKTKEVALNEGDSIIPLDTGSTSSDTSDEEVESDKKEKWDCESVISTYSNLYNHPKLIGVETKRKPIVLQGKEGIPTGILRKKHTEPKSNDEIEETTIIKASTFRPRDESPNSRKERKQNLKLERKARRVEKKEKQIIFKSEKLRQEKASIGKVCQIGL